MLISLSIDENSKKFECVANEKVEKIVEIHQGILSSAIIYTIMYKETGHGIEDYLSMLKVF